jgi:hypothetical protein
MERSSQLQASPIFSLGEGATLGGLQSRPGHCTEESNPDFTVVEPVA